MKILIQLICSLVFIGAMQAVYGQHQFADLPACLAYAYAHRNELQLGQMKQELRKEQSKMAKASRLPQVNAFSTLEDNVQLPVQLVPAEFVGGQPGTLAKIQFGTQYNFAAGLEASVSLWNRPLWNKLSESHLTIEKERFNQQAQKLQIAEAVALQYYLTLLMKERRAISEQNQLNNDTLYQTAQNQYAAGTIELLDFNRIKTLWLKGKQSLEQAKLNEQQQTDRLKLTLGISVEEEIVLPKLAAASQEEAILAATLPTTAYPTFHQMKLDEQLAQLNLKTEKDKRLPQIAAYARYTAQAQRNQFNFFDANEPWFGIGVIGVRIDVPIFSGFQRKSAIQQASIQTEITQKQSARFLNQQALSDQALVQDYQSSIKQLAFAQEMHQLSSKNYEIGLFKYQQGVCTVEQLISIHNERLAAENQYLNQLGNKLMYRAVIEVKKQFLEEKTSTSK